MSDSDLHRLEAFYAERGVPAQVELCPLAAADVAPRLGARGFVVQGFENQLGRALASGSGEGASPDVRVTRTAPAEDDAWIRIAGENVHLFRELVAFRFSF